MMLPVTVPENVYDVKVQVSDGTATDTQDLAVTVTDVSRTVRLRSPRWPAETA